MVSTCLTENQVDLRDYPWATYLRPWAQLTSPSMVIIVLYDENQKLDLATDCKK